MPAAGSARWGGAAVVCRAAAPEAGERLRLNNLAPFEGARKAKKRIGRGYGAGQGGSAGRGMRGQNSRSGGGTRPGFEGGQNPLYRRLPKLRGIAGGMPSGVKEFNVVNLNLIEANFEDGETVNLASLTAKGVLKPQGAARALPLKVLGTGEIAAKVTVEAQAFSTSAKAKLEAAGATATEIAGKRKWVRAMGKTSQKTAPGRPKKQG